MGWIILAVLVAAFTGWVLWSLRETDGPTGGTGGRRERPDTETPERE